jgi:Ni/Co efflux regulator RcnB
MKRALLTFLAVLSLSVGVAGSVATVSDARSGHPHHQHASRGEREHDRDRHECDDDRGKRSTPKACDDDHERGDRDHEDRRGHDD